MLKEFSFGGSAPKRLSLKSRACAKRAPVTAKVGKKTAKKKLVPKKKNPAKKKKAAAAGSARKSSGKSSRKKSSKKSTPKARRKKAKSQLCDFRADLSLSGCDGGLSFINGL